MNVEFILKIKWPGVDESLTIDAVLDGDVDNAATKRRRRDIGDATTTTTTATAFATSGPMTTTTTSTSTSTKTISTTTTTSSTIAPSSASQAASIFRHALLQLQHHGYASALRQQLRSGARVDVFDRLRDD